MTRKELRGIWWNVWLDARDKPDGARQIANKIAAMIKEHNPDWLCLQEVFRYDIWGEQGNLIKMIEDATGWENVFVAGSQYHYEKGKVRAGKNYTDGLATFSKWPIKSSQTITLGPWVKGQKVGLDGRRMLLEAVLDTPKGEITVGNTHWTRIHHKYRTFRKSEMEKFRKHIEELESGIAYVVGGDFNTLPSHPIISSLEEDLDLRTGTARQTTWLHRGRARGILRCNLDYVGTLKSGSMDIDDFRLLPRLPSDHAPLLGSFNFKS